MNEQIQKLIEECTSAYDDLVYDGTDSYMKTTEYFDKEKFARLIVRECGKSANEWYQNHDKIHSDPMSYVLAHFGVEE